jgi:hypothetical protein
MKNSKDVQPCVTPNCPRMAEVGLECRPCYSWWERMAMRSSFQRQAYLSRLGLASSRVGRMKRQVHRIAAIAARRRRRAA